MRLNASPMASPMDQDIQIEQLLARAIAAEEAPWPTTWSTQEVQARLVKKALYHGVAGLVNDRSKYLGDWPQDVIVPLREQALAAAMWELRHKLVMTDVLDAIAGEGIVAIVLKGTALAYDLYDRPASRARGDSDILIESGDLGAVRAILRRLGFSKHLDDDAETHDMELQELWRRIAPDGTVHDIDLHWQTMNSPALEGVLRHADCAARTRGLPRLCSSAVTMDHVLMLIHACVHRAKHLTSPYFSGSIAYYGADRLIWAQDIHLLCGALGEPDWERFTEMAVEQGLAAICLDGLALAQSRLGTPVPARVTERLTSVPQTSDAASYLLHSGQWTRAWRDLRAVKGIGGKLSYLAARALPSAEFMRAKYPLMRGRPLPLLYLRRLMDLARPRPGRSRS